jgi:hypothetical protein
VEGVAKETRNEAPSSLLGAVSSIIFVHGVFSEDYEVLQYPCTLASCYLISATFKRIPQFLNLFVSLGVTNEIPHAYYIKYEFTFYIIFKFKWL